jgi:transcriptional regulator with XRE-family HTH domain
MLLRLRHAAVPNSFREFEWVAGNVRRLRLRHGLTQEKLAARTDLTTRAISEIENAAVDMSLSTLLRLAQALEVAPGALLREAKFQKLPPGRPKPSKSRATAR